MGDQWDYKLRKLEMAWDLARRIMPERMISAGRWSESNYLDLAKEVLQKASEVVEVVFTEDK